MLDGAGEVKFEPTMRFCDSETDETDGSIGDLFYFWPRPDDEEAHSPALDWRQGDLGKQAVDALRKIAATYSDMADALAAKLEGVPYEANTRHRPSP